MVRAGKGAQSRGSLRARVGMVIGMLPGIVLHLILSIVAGFCVFYLRFAAAGCGGTGRTCNSALIEVAQNPLVFVVSLIWGMTALVSMVAAATGGRPANRVVLLGGVVTVVYLIVVAGCTLLGAYAL